MHILAVDQGTSATKAVVFGDDGETLASVEVAVTPRAVPGGGVEQDPEQLWDSVCAAGRDAIARAGGSVAAVGFANQGETVLAWDRGTGRPLSSAISWQDRRAASICADLAPHAAQLTLTTGLPLDPYFAAPKMTWLRRHVTRAGVVTTSDAWLVHRLTGAFVTDVTTASRTMLLDLERRAWSPEACAAFDLGGEDLPLVVGSAQEIGRTDAFGPSLALERVERRPAGGAGRGALPRAGRIEVHLRDRCLPARQRRRAAVHVVRRPGRVGGLATRRGRYLLHRRSGVRRRRRRRLAVSLGLPRARRGSRPCRGLGARRRRRHRGAGAERARRAMVATGRVGQHRGDRSGDRAGPRRPGDRRGVGGAGDPVGPCHRRRSRPPARPAEGGRRAHPLTDAHADTGGPAPGPGGGRVLPARHRGGRGGAGAARCRRRPGARRRDPACPRATRYEPAITAAEAEERLGRVERAVARLVGGPESAP